jgi:phytoene dehydrogenase-like protein
MGVGSPFFAGLPLHEHGLEWIYPTAPLAHPLDSGDAVILHRSIEETGAEFENSADARAYRSLMNLNWSRLAPDILGPLHLPRHPLSMARFGLAGMRSASGLARSSFQGERARALFAGLAAHSILPLQAPFSASFGIVLGLLAHAVGWPFPRGGAQRFTDALVSYARSLGVVFVTGARIEELGQLPPARAVLLDVTPRQLLAIGGDRISLRNRRTLASFRYGPGVFKLDYALSAPIPWKAARVNQAATVHLGATIEEIEASEIGGKTALRPFVLLAQHTLFDPTRAPANQHTAWAYCHVPNGSQEDMTDRIEAQIERFAPGFRHIVLARHSMTPANMEVYNPNYIGGDIGGGSSDWKQLLTRPWVRLDPYRAAGSIFLCSSSTPPGGGVHGMCGYHAAQSVLRRLLT